MANTTNTPTDPRLEALAAAEAGTAAIRLHLQLPEGAPAELLQRWGELTLAADRAEATRIAAEAEVLELERQLVELEARLNESRVGEQGQ